MARVSSINSIGFISFGEPALKTRLIAAVYKGFWTALDWVYPPECVGCGSPGYCLCENCQNKIRFSKDFKKINMSKTNSSLDNANFLSQGEILPLTFRRHLAEYEGVMRQCIHALKYHKNQSLGQFFSEMLAALIQDAKWVIDLVIPVPLSPERRKQRGYNQSVLIAMPLALTLGVPCNPFSLKRIRNTVSQVGLSAQERRQNVHGAFTGVREIVSGKSVLLVDDVTTTGATLEACAAALSKAGVYSVYAVTLAGFTKQNQEADLNWYQV